MKYLNVRTHTQVRHLTNFTQLDLFPPPQPQSDDGIVLSAREKPRTAMDMTIELGGELLLAVMQAESGENGTINVTNFEDQTATTAAPAVEPS